MTDINTKQSKIKLLQLLRPCYFFNRSVNEKAQKCYIQYEMSNSCLNEGIEIGRNVEFEI